MFEHHKQRYGRTDLGFEEWEAKKAEGKGGEFGGGLPQAFFNDKG